jgi:hypothetical protein
MINGAVSPTPGARRSRPAAPADTITARFASTIRWEISSVTLGSTVKTLSVKVRDCSVPTCVTARSAMAVGSG